MGSRRVVLGLPPWHLEWDLDERDWSFDEERPMATKKPVVQVPPDPRVVLPPVTGDEQLARFRAEVLAWFASIEALLDKMGRKLDSVLERLEDE